ncbi:MAG TPA: DUF4197 domain-containing protein [Candidatus Acidoferrales bacterium]|nr:DUF4197 domain-containing protein [Candidatus Acidoferrales bacterium]
MTLRLPRARACRLLLVSAVLYLAAPAFAQLDQIFKGFGGSSAPSLGDAKIASGLKEALRVGAENAVASTGAVDGYFKNRAIKIPMPSGLRPLEQGLRAVGYGPQVDEFILSMNRAAERAAPFAKEIFWDAIASMTIEDARKILAGNDTAATDYFKSKTSDKLAVAFRPAVEKSMSEVGVTRRYKELVGRYETIPFARSAAFDIDGYVVEKAIDGLFYVVGQEEKKIRTNPAARVNDLLKEVFGSRG